MPPRTHGIHHVTAIVSDAQHNIDFYAGFLGLRLVKVTVNFDDPGSYHLYYGDEVGHPGTVMTFFVWPNGERRRSGTAQVGVTAFAIRLASLQFWTDRLRGSGIPAEAPVSRFDEQVLTFEDPDGLILELVAHPGAEDLPFWAGGPVAGEHALRGFHGVTLYEEGFAHTQRLLTDTLGFLSSTEEGNLLKVPPWLEPHRQGIVRHLPPLQLPGGNLQA